MEKRNRLDRRGQSPPPKKSNGNTARVVAAIAVALGFLAFAAVLLTGIPTGTGRLFALAAPLLPAVGVAAVGWLNYRTARINRETAELNLETARLNRDSARQAAQRRD